MRAVRGEGFGGLRVGDGGGGCLGDGGSCGVGDGGSNGLDPYETAGDGGTKVIERGDGGTTI